MKTILATLKQKGGFGKATAGACSGALTTLGIFIFARKGLG